MEKGLLIVVSGPSGAGKGTIIGKAFESKKSIEFSVSCTTRSPRKGEKHGENYYFITHEEFDERIANDGFLEYAEFAGNKYGTPKDKVIESLEKGIDIILEIEVQGATEVKQKMPEAVMIFVVPPSLEELESRLVGRGTEDKRQTELRLETAKKELELINSYDYVIKNDEVDKATEKLLDIISAEKCRVNRNPGLQELLLKGEKLL